MPRKRQIAKHPENFGEVLAALADAAGVDQGELDRRIHKGKDYTRNLESRKAPPPDEATVRQIAAALRKEPPASPEDVEHNRQLDELWDRVAAPERLKAKGEDLWEWHEAEVKRAASVKLTPSEAALLGTLASYPEPDPELPARRGLDESFMWGEPVEHDGRSVVERLTEVLRMTREEPAAVRALHTILDILACQDFPSSARRRMLAVAARDLDSAQDRYQEGVATGRQYTPRKVFRSEAVIKDGKFHEVVGSTRAVEQTTDWTGEVVDEKPVDDGMPD